MLVHCSCLQTHQKRASAPITDSCEPPWGCWELNSEPLEEQSVLLTTEPFLHPLRLLFSTNGAGSTGGQHIEECKLIHSYLPVQSSSPSLIKDLHIKPDTLKLIEEKVGKEQGRRDFLNRTPIDYVLRSTIWQMGPVSRRTLSIEQNGNQQIRKRSLSIPDTIEG